MRSLGPALPSPESRPLVFGDHRPDGRDVVVLNFVDRSDEPDRRVYELLEQKFKLLEGVFGVSDVVLGAVGSGVDVERRIGETT
jgi:hypothetical protein